MGADLSSFFHGDQAFVIFLILILLVLGLGGY